MKKKILKKITKKTYELLVKQDDVWQQIEFAGQLYDIQFENDLSEGDVNAYAYLVVDGKPQTQDVEFFFSTTLKDIQQALVKSDCLGKTVDKSTEKEYEVDISFHSNLTFYVDANNEFEAKEKAFENVCNELNIEENLEAIIFDYTARELD